LPSVRAQAGVDLEVVVVDDGSSDGTAERLAALDNDRLRVLRNERPRGQPAARNAGAEVAGGRWLAFLDDDDLWSPDKLRLQLDRASATGALWAYGRAVVVDSSLRVIEDDPFPAPQELASLLLHGNWIPGGGSNVVVRADAFSRVGGFAESLRLVEDWDLWLRLLGVGAPASCDEVVMARMEHGSNSMVRDWAEVKVVVERMMSKYRLVTDADRRGVAEWLALEQHRAGRRLSAARMYLSIALHHRSPGNLPIAAGALFGAPGLELASRLLVKTRGSSHVEAYRTAARHEPGWLDLYRHGPSANEPAHG
jgi:glycosyltransferase involved in cell wall biosynthesis